MIGHDAESQQAVAFSIQALNFLHDHAGNLPLRQPAGTLSEALIQPVIIFTKVLFVHDVALTNQLIPLEAKT
jgi:hypothetical protein